MTAQKHIHSPIKHHPCAHHDSVMIQLMQPFSNQCPQTCANHMQTNLKPRCSYSSYGSTMPQVCPGTRFSKVPKRFHTQKAVAKTVSNLIYVFFIQPAISRLHTRCFRRIRESFTIFASLAYISNSVSDGATNKSVLNIEM